ncbi:MAG: DUF190 domain-containing protein [Novosphingobium sp.]
MTTGRTYTLDRAELGMVRIYLRRSDRIRKRGWFGLRSSIALHHHLVVKARANGILNAVSHHTHFGYSNHGSIGADGAEWVDPQLTICVELIGESHQLETFCLDHGELLDHKVITYKPLERWQITDKA